MEAAPAHGLPSPRLAPTSATKRPADVGADTLLLDKKPRVAETGVVWRPASAELGNELSEHTADEITEPGAPREAGIEDLPNDVLSLVLLQLRVKVKRPQDIAPLAALRLVCRRFEDAVAGLGGALGLVTEVEVRLQGGKGVFSSWLLERAPRLVSLESLHCTHSGAGSPSFEPLLRALPHPERLRSLSVGPHEEGEILAAARFPELRRLAVLRPTARSSAPTWHRSSAAPSPPSPASSSSSSPAPASTPGPRSSPRWRSTCGASGRLPGRPAWRSCAWSRARRRSRRPASRPSRPCPPSAASPPPLLARAAPAPAPGDLPRLEALELALVRARESPPGLEEWAAEALAALAPRLRRLDLAGFRRPGPAAAAGAEIAAAPHLRTLRLACDWRRGAARALLARPPPSLRLLALAEARADLVARLAARCLPRPCALRWESERNPFDAPQQRAAALAVLAARCLPLAPAAPPV
eukprot:tig00001071_g6797.t1